MSKIKNLFRYRLIQNLLLAILASLIALLEWRFLPVGIFLYTSLGISALVLLYTAMRLTIYNAYAAAFFPPILLIFTAGFSSGIAELAGSLAMLFCFAILTRQKSRGGVLGAVVLSVAVRNLVRLAVFSLSSDGDLFWLLPWTLLLSLIIGIVFAVILWFFRTK